MLNNLVVDKIERSGFKVRKVIFLFDIVAIVIAGLSSVLQNDPLNFIVIFLVILSLFFKDDIQCVYTMIILFPFEYSLSFEGKGLLFLLTYTIALRIIFLNRNKKINLTTLLCGFIIIILEVTNSLGNGVSLFTMIHWVGIFSLFLVTILYVDFSKWNQLTATRNFVLAYLVVIFATFISAGSSWEIFFTQISGVIQMNDRFGYSLSSLGGAMGIPFYSLITISLLLINLEGQKINKTQKIVFISLIIFSLIIGLITVSRLFIIGILLVELIFTMSFISMKIKVRNIIYLFLIFMITFGLYVIIESLMQGVLSRIIYRMGTTVNDSRILIQMQSFKFLSENWNYALVGLGTNYYPIYGSLKGYLFSAHTHNIYLDALMSWGIIGSISFLVIIRKFVKKCRISKKSFKRTISIAPISIILFWFLSAGTFSSYRDYIFILLAICSYYFGVKEREI